MPSAAAGRQEAGAAGSGTSDLNICILTMDPYCSV